MTEQIVLPIHGPMAATSRIVSAYISYNTLSVDEIPHLIKRIYDSVYSLSHRSPNMVRAATTPAVAIEDSVCDDYLICLEDGKKLSMLKRHLGSVYGMTLDQYKERWNLPPDYPTVSPNYARRRSAIAKTIGLGKNGRKSSKLKVA